MKNDYLTQVILGIIFPPLILLLDFRLGDDASYQAPARKEEGKDKDDETKSSKVLVHTFFFIRHVPNLRVNDCKLAVCCDAAGCQH